jgi:hypothetical protein
LWWIAPRPDADSDSSAWAPVFGPGIAGAEVHGRF